MPNNLAASAVSPPPLDPLLDIDEVAEFLHVCRATVYREVKRGNLPAHKVAHTWRFKRENVLAYLNGETPASAAERAEWDAYVRKVKAEAPTLRPEQIAALSALLDWEPGTDGDGDHAA